MSSTVAVAWAAFAIGLVFGVLGRWSGFCMRGAIEDALTDRAAPRLRSFLLAMAVALIATQALVLTGHLDISKATVLPKSLFWGGAVLGGALFGVGMVLTGGCGTQLLVLAAGGNLRSVVSFVVFSLVAYATIRGILAPSRAALMDMSSLTLGKPTLPLVVGGVAAVVALALAFRRRVEPRHLIAGALIGLLVPAGYLATAVLGGDEFEPATVESINVTRAGGDALVYLLTWTGAKISFGIAFVGGVLVGSALVMAGQRDFKLIGFDRPIDMLRYALGGALMGVGGVLALGCTIGNGLTGFASLAPTSFIAVPAMVLAAGATMKWRWASAGR
ncbi:MAG: YeeE/YedE family protein [Alphaproteobacteria bacterium]|nr:YeeE/YedE family protein [Alphaproteobacteria bacterium]